MQYLFEACGFERVELKTDVLNVPARKAMLKLGLVEEGILRSHTQMIHNRRRDTICYSLLGKNGTAEKILTSKRGSSGGGEMEVWRKLRCAGSRTQCNTSLADSDRPTA